MKYREVCAELTYEQHPEAVGLTQETHRSSNRAVCPGSRLVTLLCSAKTVSNVAFAVS